MSGWLLSRRMEFTHFLAVLLSIAPWYIFLGGVVVLALLLGPLASTQGHFLAGTLYAVQSLNRSPLPVPLVGSCHGQCTAALLGVPACARPDAYCSPWASGGGISFGSSYWYWFRSSSAHEEAS